MSIFTTTLELTLSKIREKNNRPAPLWRGGAETQIRRLGRKKFFWGVGQKEIFCALVAAEIFREYFRIFYEKMAIEIIYEIIIYYFEKANSLPPLALARTTSH